MGNWDCNSTYDCRDLVGERSNSRFSTTYHLIRQKRLKSSNRNIFPFFLGVKMTKQVLKPPPSHQVTIWLVLLGILSTEYDQPYTLEVQTPSSKKTSFTILYRKGLSPFKRSFIISRKIVATTSRVYNDFRTWRLGPIAARHAQHGLAKENPSRSHG